MLQVDTDWGNASAVVLDVRRSSGNVGLALVLLDSSSGKNSYSCRLPLNSVGAWEEVAVGLDQFQTLSLDGPTLRSNPDRIDGYVLGVFLYSLDGQPLTASVHIDQIAVP